MYCNHFSKRTIVVAASLFFALGSIALANPHEGQAGNVPPGQLNRPAPIVVPPNGIPPNGMPPIGKPLAHPDLDRGHSEGKGHNDAAHVNHAARTVRGTLSSFTANTVTIMTAGGLQTYRTSENTYDKLQKLSASHRTSLALVTKNGRVVTIK